MKGCEESCQVIASGMVNLWAPLRLCWYVYMYLSCSLPGCSTAAQSTITLSEACFASNMIT